METNLKEIIGSIRFELIEYGPKDSIYNVYRVRREKFDTGKWNIPLDRLSPIYSIMEQYPYRSLDFGWLMTLKIVDMKYNRYPKRIPSDVIGLEVDVGKENIVYFSKDTYLGRENCSFRMDVYKSEFFNYETTDSVSIDCRIYLDSLWYQKYPKKKEIKVTKETLSVYEIPEKTKLHFFRVQRSTAGSIYRVTDSSKKLVHMIHKMMHVKLDPETKDISFELHLRDRHTCPHNCLDYIGSSSDETTIVYTTSAESTIVVFPMEFVVEVSAIDTRSDLGPECMGITGKYLSEDEFAKLNKDEALKKSLDFIRRNSIYGINPKWGMTPDGKPYMLDYSYRSNKTAVWMTVGDVCGYKIFTTHSFFPLRPGETYEVLYADRTCRKLDLSLKRTNCYHFSDNLIKKIVQIKEIICDQNRTIICMKNEIFEKISMFSMEIDIHNFDPTVPNEFNMQVHIVDYTTNAYGITCKHPNSAIAKEYEFIKELNKKWRDEILNKGLKSFHQEVLEKTGVDTKKLDLPDWMNMASFVDYNIHDCFNSEKLIKVCRPYSYNDAYGTILLREMHKMFGSNYFDIEDIKFNGVATIVFWKDGTKTVVKCHEDEKEFDIEKAIMAAFMKRALESKVGVPAKDKSMDRLLGEWVAKYEKEKEIEKLKKPSNAKKKKTTRKKTEE